MKLLIANIILWGSIAAYALPAATDKELNNAQAVIINHKYDNLDGYEQSEKAQVIKAANASLKKIKAGN